MEERRLQGGCGRKEELVESELAPCPGPGSAMLLRAQRVAVGEVPPLYRLTSWLLEGVELGGSVRSPPALPVEGPLHCRAPGHLHVFSC